MAAVDPFLSKTENSLVFSLIQALTSSGFAALRLLHILIIALFLAGCSGEDPAPARQSAPSEQIEASGAQTMSEFLNDPDNQKLAKNIHLLNGLFDSLDVAMDVQDYSTEAVLKSELANHFRLSGNYDKSLRFYQEAVQASGRSQSNVNLGEIYHGLASLYYEMYFHDSVQTQFLDSAAIYANQAYELVSVSGDWQLIVYALNVQGAVEIQLGNYESARSLLEKACSIAEEEGSDPGLATKANIAYVYHKMGAYQDGLRIIEETYYQSLEEENLVFAGVALRLMGQIYRDMGDIRRASETDRLLSDISDDKYMMLQTLVMEQQLLNYELRKEQDEVSGLYRERFHLIRGSRILAFSLILLVLILFVLMYLLRQNRKIREKEMELIRERHKAHELELQNSALEIAAKEAEAKALSVDLEARNLTLATKLLNLSKVNEFLSVLSHDIAQISDGNGDKNIAASLKKIDAQIKKQLNNNVWDDFELLYGSGNSSFINQLLQKHPELTTQDKRLCYLILYDLTTKEIADILMKSYRSVEMARYRLRNKLGLERDAHLRDYLLLFAK